MEGYWQIERHEEIDSTNRRALELARAGAPSGTVVVSSRQTSGCGRRSRHWHSPAGGLWFSLLLRPGVAPECTAAASLMAGVSVVSTLRRLYGRNDICLKWPNDILIGEKKIVGILAEMALDADGSVDFLVIGIGINVDLPPDTWTGELKDRAVSLRTATGVVYAPDEVLREALTDMKIHVGDWEANGMSKILPAWLAMNNTIGREVIVKDDGRVIWSGTATALSEDGSLTVRREDGCIQTFSFGEISIR